jgi:hypothetical protein
MGKKLLLEKKQTDWAIDSMSITQAVCGRNFFVAKKAAD